MGQHHVQNSRDEEARVKFTRHLIDDIKALEVMLEKGLIEDDIERIGSEQEFCLINENWRPTCKALEILQELDDPHFTTEIAQYNLEINLDPIELKKDCFSFVEKQLINLLAKAGNAASKHDTKILLTGILPTISKSELQFEYMTPNTRYQLLNDMIRKYRGGDIELHIRGVDELSINHESVLFEACNTSFQMHLQIAPNDFVSSYNWAQAISGPILGVCTNSPLLLGRELWSETRIALFRQSVDTRSSSYALKDRQARVTFGKAWASGSIAEMYKHDIARYKLMLIKDIESNSLEQLDNGITPKLSALNVHNGTIYRWNRPCYGVGGGKAHVRIENRYVPAGPSVLDQMANFAFWVGLMAGRPAEFDDMKNQMDFRDANANFIKAARTGRESVLLWKDKLYSARDLVINELLPIAYSGLEKKRIDKADIERLLGVIEKRTVGMTGSKWQINNYRKLQKELKQDDALVLLTKEIYQNQQANLPVHTWPTMKQNQNPHTMATQVRHIMSTQLFLVNKNDLSNLATNVMLWKGIHHLPVENDDGELVGLLTWKHMKEHAKKPEADSANLVSNIMIKDVITAEPETLISDAIRLMIEKKIGCLPVVRDKDLVGIITVKDVIALQDD
ncbi:CBS domain-containing protein [Spongiivirga citrea]|uniref:CBS domain-containing protein n=1 Tax=Spongiivirga citrea TaxID=1481457 RepID=A0A6M0CSI6_9FLAO|nr:CBS domain-containing protein [Spongiivirga citrea]NER16820.1 CBS domain-containing protein [Spongiivirga citrea]